ncbi:MAG: hypothetical protein OXG04_26340 [Acidobacteria bacterium]|nr:hypothetical protein [Acidobacteriota bacterium]
MLAPHVQGNPGDALRGVHVERNPAITGQPADRLDVGDRPPDLVVDVHQRQEDRVVAQRRLHERRRDQTVRSRHDTSDLEPVFFEMAAGIENGLVLDGRGHGVGAPVGIGGDGCTTSL